MLFEIKYCLGVQERWMIRWKFYDNHSYVYRDLISEYGIPTKNLSRYRVGEFIFWIDCLKLNYCEFGWCSYDELFK